MSWDFDKGNDDDEFGIPMKSKLSDVLSENMKLDYEYDFGSTTPILITVNKEYPIKSEEDIVLLSRNEPLEILCDTCHKEPATQLCTVCIDDESFFCKTCAKKHAKKCEDFADYASMPVVNSPRMGVCAYEGGSIDLQRDGVCIKKALAN